MTSERTSFAAKKLFSQKKQERLGLSLLSLFKLENFILLVFLSLLYLNIKNESIKLNVVGVADRRGLSQTFSQNTSKVRRSSLVL